MVHNVENDDLFTKVKEIYSMALLAFSVVIVSGLVFSGQTTLSRDVHPALAFVVLVCAVAWLTMIEGGQATLVGLVPVNSELFKDTHPTTYISTKWICHTGDNLDRYLLGRQLMVVLVVFTINMAGAPVKGAELWGFPDIVTQIFLVSGLAMILFTCMIGQLNSQVNGCHCMLDYANNYFCVGTVCVARAIEFSGILHASYFFALLVSIAAGKPIESKEPPRDGFQSFFHWARILLSLTLLGMALAVTISALFNGQTNMWDSVPPVASVFLFILFLCIIGLLEGMQIAFWNVTKKTKEERGKAKFAMMTCDVLFRNGGRNLPGFMVGRQLTVVSCMFIMARITSISLEEGEPNIFGVPDGVQKFLNTGLQGAFVVTIIGSIAWQLVAQAFPLAFLSNPLVYVMLRIALALEATGICQGAWVLARLHAYIAGFQADEVYIGTAEERAARQMGDDPSDLKYTHMAKLPVFADSAPESLKALFRNDPSVLFYVSSLRNADVQEYMKTSQRKLDEDTDVEKGDDDGDDLVAIKSY